MPSISKTTGKGPHAPEPFHSAPGVPSPENTKLPSHAHNRTSDTKEFGNLLPHVAPHSTLGEVSAACGHLNTADAATFATFVALSGGPNSKIGHALMKNSKELGGAELPKIAVNALSQTLVEEGYKA